MATVVDRGGEHVWKKEIHCQKGSQRELGGATLAFLKFSFSFFLSFFFL
jgi:hypothetical protein